MPLSVEKLETFLSKHGMVPNSFFTLTDGTISYIEILSIEYSDMFMLHIPDKYKMKINKDVNVFPLTKRIIYDNGNIFDQYVDKDEMLNVESRYEEIMTSVDINTVTNVEKYVEEKYNRPINLFNDDRTTGNNIIRQLRRIGLCMQGTKYSIGINTHDMMFNMYSGTNVVNYNIEGADKHNDRKLFVIVDLEVLFDRINTINKDISEIRHKILEILIRNCSTHLDTIINEITKSSGLQQQKNTMISTNREFAAKLAEYTKTLDSITRSEQSLIEKKIEAETKLRTNSSYKSSKIDSDIKRIYNEYESRLVDITDRKRYITRAIIDTQIKQWDRVLKMDDLVFESVVMIQTIFKNILSVSSI